MLVRVQFNARACAYVCVLFTLSTYQESAPSWLLYGRWIYKRHIVVSVNTGASTPSNTTRRLFCSVSEDSVCYLYTIYCKIFEKYP